jgi:hypothetical protein
LKPKRGNAHWRKKTPPVKTLNGLTNIFSDHRLRGGLSDGRPQMGDPYLGAAGHKRSGLQLLRRGAGGRRLNRLGTLRIAQAVGYALLTVARLENLDPTDAWLRS